MRIRAACRFGLLLAMLALVSTVALGAIVWPDSARQDRIAALDAISVVCQGGKPAAPAHRPPPHAQPSLCPPAAAFAVPLALLAGGPSLPPPRASLALAHGRGAAAIRAGGVPEAAFPRGPPTRA